MPAETVLDTSIEHVSILDQDGNFDAELGKGLIPDKDAVHIYEQMQISRHFDEVALKLQREGRMGTYPENRGQEAVSLGAVYALRPDDWIVPCYRENAGIFWRGYKPEWVLLHWMGDERGNQIDRDLWITPPSISIGGHTPHAVGLAWACRYRKEDRIVCTVFGDGASSQGDCHEACNFAASLCLPVIFICQNNGWAISVPSGSLPLSQVTFPARARDATGQYSDWATGSTTVSACGFVVVVVGAVVAVAAATCTGTVVGGVVGSGLSVGDVEPDAPSGVPVLV